MKEETRLYDSPEIRCLRKLLKVEKTDFYEETVSCQCGRWTGKKWGDLVCDKCGTRLTPVRIHYIGCGKSPK